MTHTHSQVASPETANVPARDQGALLMIASPEILKRLSALSRHAGHVATVWHGERGPPDSAALLGNRIIFIEVQLDWTGAIEALCRFKDQSFSGLVVLVGGENATTLEQVHTVGSGLGLRMAPTLGRVYRDAQVADLLSAPTPAVVEDAVVFDVREALARDWLELWYQP